MLSIFAQARTISANSNAWSSLIVMMLMTCFLWVAPNAAAQDPTNIRLVVVDGANQIAMLGQALPRRFTVRLTDDLGVPLAGVLIAFANNNACFVGAPPPMAWVTCDVAADLGHFVQVEPMQYVVYSNQIGQSLTDSNGIAVAPAYIVGSSPGGFSVWAYPIDPRGRFLGQMVYFQFYQSATVPIPALSPLALIALAAALGLVGFQILRWRPKGSLFSPRK